MILLRFRWVSVGFLAWIAMGNSVASSSPERFEGRYFSGTGDVEYLQLLDVARRMFAPDPEFQNLSMLYQPDWNGLTEGPHWNGWWIQNSYGTTYCALPFYEEPWVTFLQNSQDLWFDQMGDGKRVGDHNWVAPDGCLCDCARPGWVMYKQGDGRIDIHDWGMEFTAAGLLMQAELLLISRDQNAINHYLPMLERCAAFIETRRDPENNLFLAGPAGNLLAPSYTGWKRPDGTYGQAYLAGLSVTYIAALDRLSYLEDMAGRHDQAEEYRKARGTAWTGLQTLVSDEGYLIRSLDPDGVRHGVFGAEQHGYFETSPNHDAIAFRVIGGPRARKIYDKIASIPGLRPYDFILPNYPSYDDMYEQPKGLWEFGRWVNGGHWSTCEARMILAYYRLAEYEDARRSMRRLLTFAEQFRMDNPLTNFGSDVYLKKDPIHLCYDTFGPAAALIRGLFEYLYLGQGLILTPQIPPSITSLEQHFPIRFGRKRLYLSTFGSGPVTSVSINGEPWRHFDAKKIWLVDNETPDVASIAIYLGETKPDAAKPKPIPSGEVPDASSSLQASGNADLDEKGQHLSTFHARLVNEGLGESYEARHARLALDAINTIGIRREMLKTGKIQPLPEPAGSAAEKSYLDAAVRLCLGLEKTLSSYAASDDPIKKKIHKLWSE
jgi:hypothetical protein